MPPGAFCVTVIRVVSAIDDGAIHHHLNYRCGVDRLQDCFALSQSSSSCYSGTADHDDSVHQGGEHASLREWQQRRRIDHDRIKLQAQRLPVSGASRRRRTSRWQWSLRPLCPQSKPSSLASLLRGSNESSAAPQASRSILCRRQCQMLFATFGARRSASTRQVLPWRESALAKFTARVDLPSLGSDEVTSITRSDFDARASITT